MYRKKNPKSKERSINDMNLIKRLDRKLTRKYIELTTKEAVDQIVIIFIIIAVAAGIAGLLYFFGTKTFLPSFEDKLSSLVDGWFGGR